MAKLNSHSRYIFTCVLVILVMVEQGDAHILKGLADLPALRDIVVKEGSSTLIECNVTGSHDDILWYNSKGHILDEKEGGKLAYRYWLTFFLKEMYTDNYLYIYI